MFYKEDLYLPKLKLVSPIRSFICFQIVLSSTKIDLETKWKCTLPTLRQILQCTLPTLTKSVRRECQSQFILIYDVIPKTIWNKAHRSKTFYLSINLHFIDRYYGFSLICVSCYKQNQNDPFLSLPVTHTQSIYWSYGLDMKFVD